MPEPRADADLELSALLERAAHGDDRAWRSLLGHYAPRVFAMARSRVGGLGGHDLAEEVTQSVFVTVAEKLVTGRYSDRGRFEAWLFRVTMNRVRDEFRRRKRRPMEAFDGAVHDSAAAQPEPVTGETPAEHAALRRALEGLSDPDRTVIELRHHGGLGFKQIAEALGEPMGTVLARHHRALRKLKALMEEDGADASDEQAGTNNAATRPHGRNA